MSITTEVSLLELALLEEARAYRAAHKKWQELCDSYVPGQATREENEARHQAADENDKAQRLCVEALKRLARA